jgi:hypothetical protein
MTEFSRLFPSQKAPSKRCHIQIAFTVLATVRNCLLPQEKQCQPEEGREIMEEIAGCVGKKIKDFSFYKGFEISNIKYQNSVG